MRLLWLGRSVYMLLFVSIIDYRSLEYSSVCSVSLTQMPFWSYQLVFLLYLVLNPLEAVATNNDMKHRKAVSLFASIYRFPPMRLGPSMCSHSLLLMKLVSFRVCVFGLSAMRLDAFSYVYLSRMHILEDKEIDDK